MEAVALLWGSEVMKKSPFSTVNQEFKCLWTSDVMNTEVHYSHRESLPLILLWTRYIQFKVKTGSVIFYNIFLRQIRPNSHTLAMICPRNFPQDNHIVYRWGDSKGPFTAELCNLKSAVGYILIPALHKESEENPSGSGNKDNRFHCLCIIAWEHNGGTCVSARKFHS
jgi:hypothetical protein